LEVVVGIIRGRIDSADHPRRAVRIRGDGFAKVPDRFRIIRDGQVPYSRWGICVVSDSEEPAVESAVKRRAGRIAGGLGNAMVSANEIEGDDVAHGRVDSRRNEEQPLVAHVDLYHVLAPSNLDEEQREEERDVEHREWRWQL